MWEYRPLIRTIQDDSSERNTVSTGGAGILATESDLVPMGTDPRRVAPVRSVRSPEPVDWQSAMKRAIRSTDKLRERLGLPISSKTTSADSECGSDAFPTFVPLEFLSRMRPGDPHDPLLRQVMVTEEENVPGDGFVSDPVGDLASLSTPGMIHKYHGRALLISTGACGVHCRYCFRREFPYGEVGSTAKDWGPAIEYLGKEIETDEVILSGGDPLTLVDSKLFDLIEKLESVPHLKRLRIHTRMPVVIPQRVTPELVSFLRNSRLVVWVVIHVNHPRELDEQVLDRIGMLVDEGIPVLNQAVLLKGVNDEAQTLIDLNRALVNHRIQPYYLHQLDRVRGAAHFEVPVQKGLELMEELRRNLPGYAVPTYVREDAGQPSKTTLQD